MIRMQAICAQRMPRQTNRLSESHQQRIQFCPQRTRQPRFQRNACLLLAGRRLFGPIQSLANAMDVRIDTDAGGHVPRDTHADMRHFRTDAGQCAQTLKSDRNVRVVFIDENARKSTDILRFHLERISSKTPISVILFWKTDNAYLVEGNWT